MSSDAEGLVVATVDGKVAKRREASVGRHFAPPPPREPTGLVAEIPDDQTPSEAFRRRLAERRAEKKEESLHTRWSRIAKREGKRAQQALKELERDLSRGDEGDELMRQGELLRASFHLLRPGLDSIRVPDHTQSPPVEVEIALNPKRDPGEHVASLFTRARKLRATAEHAREREAETRTRAEGWDEVLTWLAAQTESGVEVGALDAFPDEIADLLRAEPATPQKKPKGPRRALPYFTFRSADGWRILVGRSARQSDELTLKVAKPHDLFVHVRATEGSHVIVPTPRGKTVPKETLLDAAELACLFSKRAKAEHNEVDYVQRRHVRKPRGSAPGFVLFSRESTLGLRLDPARRARLQAARERADI